MHCLIIRGRKGTVVRRWCRETRLNGRDFDDSWLQPGDRLSLGQIELEVLTDRLPDEVPAVPAEPVPAPTVDGENVPSADPSASHAQAATSEDVNANDLRREVEERLEQLLEHQRLATEREDELARRQSEFETEQEAWCQRRDAQLTEFNARDECLKSLREEIEMERKALASDMQAVRQRETDADEMARHVEQLRIDLAEAQQQRNELDALVDQLRRERDHALEAAFRQETAQAGPHSDPPQDRRDDDAKRTPSIDAAVDPEPNETIVEDYAAEATEEPFSDAAVAPSSEAVEEPYSEVEHESVTEAEDESITEAEDESITEAVEEPSTGVVQEPVRDGDEFSIEDNMSQLLQRVGGGSSQPKVEAAPPQPVPVRPAPKPKKVHQPAPKPSGNDSELVPRAQPLPVDLVALRDVANQTARLAIERHTSRVWLQAAMGKFFVVAVSTIATGGLLYWTRTHSSRSGFALVAAFLVAVVWSSQAIWLMHRAIRVRMTEKRARKQNQALPKQIQTPPPDTSQ